MTTETFIDSVTFLEQLRTKPESYWIRKGERRALRLFSEMSLRVPAYKDFLKKNSVNPQTIKTISDFKQVPTLDKNNYLRAYPLESLCWDGVLKSSRWTFSTTSGSTGEPYYFPRQEYQDRQYAFTAELYLRSNFKIHEKSTLYIVGFPMGAWIGGLFTYQALQYVAERGDYSLSVITPGINKLEIIKAIKNLGHHFDQIIIGSYAPFLKDILDDGERYGLDWKNYNLGFVFSAEGFSETFRDYVQKKAGVKNIYLDTLNHYGTVDLGTMSHETPLAILLRKLAVNDEALFKSLFSQIHKLPTLTQYNPEHFFFESENGNLICSAFSGLPLVRYDLKDHGGILTLAQIHEICEQQSVKLGQKMREIKISDTFWNLPFVYVHERSDFSVSFFAFQIYPETVRKALQEEQFEDSLTGKFTMLVDYDKNGDQYFEVNIELKSGVSESGLLLEMTRNSIRNTLLSENSEYRKTTEEYPDKTLPRIVFWPYEDPTYFRPGTKQKWVKKN